MNIVYLIQTLRVRQYLKNLFIFAPLVFTANITNLPLLLETIFAFFIFCLLSSTVYVFNDIIDINKDRLHPIKKNRPIASGRLSIKHAILFDFILILIVSTVCFLYFSNEFILVATSYLLLNIIYTSYLKNLVIIDVLCVSIGFVLRVLAGIIVIEATISPWIIVCTLLIALFIALIKRREELIVLGEVSSNHRDTLKEYSIPLIDQLIQIVASACIVAYSLYTFTSETARGTTYLMVTIPFVIFGIFRYIYLVYDKKERYEPEVIILKDKPLLFNIILWLLVCMLVLYLG